MSLLAWLGKEKVKSLETQSLERWKALEEKISALGLRIDKQELAMKEFQTNYLDRFASVNKNINDSKEQIIDKIHALELKQKE